VAASGTTSVADALRQLDGNPPTLVVIDPSLSPDVGLLDAVLRSRAKAVVVANSHESVERARVAGLTEIVDRNAGLEALVLSIRRLLDSRVKVMGRDQGVPILVVDDEDEIRRVLSEFLIDKGYSVQIAKNGADAVNAVNRDVTLQVVLLDVSMPQMGGMEALRHMMDRDDPPSVIMMTAVADREIARQAMKAGAFDYMLKPFDFAAIDASILACISQKEFQKQPWWKRLMRRS